MRSSALGVRFSDGYRTVAESRILDTLLLGGWAYEQGKPEAIAATRQALDRWIDMGLGVRLGPTGERLFDPVEVLNVLKKLGLEDRDRFWADRYVHTGRRLVTDFMANTKQSVRVDFKRAFNLGANLIGKGLRLRAPLPLRSVHGESFEVEALVDGSPGAQLRVSDGRLEARLTVLNEGTVTLGAKLAFSSAVMSSPAAVPPFSPYLKSHEGLVSVTDQVNALAHSLAGPGADRNSVVRAVWNYMMDELICGAVHYDQIPAEGPCDWILQTGWYDCQLGSALFVALCRARGIPARIIGGHVLYRRAPTNHYWAEVWLEEKGWTPFDFLSWDLSLGGRDLQWRDHFYGRIDDRMVTQVLPFEFTGALGVTLPNVWHILQTVKGSGVEISLVALNTEPLYSDIVSISD